MNVKFSSHIWLMIFVISLILQACGANEPIATVAATSTVVFRNTPEPPQPTSTVAHVSALVPSPTPRPTQTPNATLTQSAQQINAEVQAYFNKGYLTTTEGVVRQFPDFKGEWAQLNWYKVSQWLNIEIKDFYMSAHFKWSSAYRNASTSGCGFIFAQERNADHYAVFLDRSKVLFVEAFAAEGYYRPIGKTRGTGRVNLGNPFEQPAEAEFGLIVKGAYAYVLVNGEVVSEYSLSQSKLLRGGVGLAILSGTNKDFGTRCEITNLHVWLPKN